VQHCSNHLKYNHQLIYKIIAGKLDSVWQKHPKGVLGYVNSNPIPNWKHQNSKAVNNADWHVITKILTKILVLSVVFYNCKMTTYFTWLSPTSADITVDFPTHCVPRTPTTRKSCWSNSIWILSKSNQTHFNVLKQISEQNSPLCKRV